MKAWAISDFHVARTDLLHGRKLTVPRADICICAGDISNDIERSIDFLHAEIATHMPVVAVLSNHDYYGSSIDQALVYARKWTAGTNVHILEDQTVQVADLRLVALTNGRTSRASITISAIWQWMSGASSPQRSASGTCWTSG